MVGFCVLIPFRLPLRFHVSVLQPDLIVASVCVFVLYSTALYAQTDRVLRGLKMRYSGGGFSVPIGIFRRASKSGLLFNISPHKNLSYCTRTPTAARGCRGHHVCGPV